MPLLAALLDGLFVLLRGFLATLWSRLLLFIQFVIPLALDQIIRLLGISIITYAGLDLAIDQLTDFLDQRFIGLPNDLLQILLLLKVDIGMKMIGAAMSMAITIKLTYKPTRMVWSKPSTT